MKDEDFLRSMKIVPDTIPEFHAESLGEFLAAMPARLFQAMRFTNETLGRAAQKRANDPSWKALAITGWITAAAFASLAGYLVREGVVLR